VGGLLALLCVHRGGTVTITFVTGSRRNVAISSISLVNSELEGHQRNLMIIVKLKVGAVGSMVEGTTLGVPGGVDMIVVGVVPGIIDVTAGRVVALVVSGAEVSGTVAGAVVVTVVAGTVTGAVVVMVVAGTVAGAVVVMVVSGAEVSGAEVSGTVAGAVVVTVVAGTVAGTVVVTVVAGAVVRTVVEGTVVVTVVGGLIGGIILLTS